MFRNTVQTLGVMAAALLAGCVQFSDTLNRPQVSTLPADGGMTVFDQNHAMSMTDAPQTQTAAATAQAGGVHPNILYFYEKLCANTSPEEPPCNPSDGVVAYQDEDVALVTTMGFPAFEGSGGHDLNLLDLKGKPGSILFHDGPAGSEKVVRKGQRITITYAQNIGGKKRKVIDLNKKPRATDVCKIYGC